MDVVSGELSVGIRTSNAQRPTSNAQVASAVHGPDAGVEQVGAPHEPFADGSALTLTLSPRRGNGYGTASNV